MMAFQADQDVLGQRTPHMDRLPPTWRELFPPVTGCSNVWIPEDAAFGRDCVAPITYLPALLAIVVFAARYALRPAWRRRPAWLRAFAAEPIRRTRWAAWMRPPQNGHAYDGVGQEDGEGEEDEQDAEDGNLNKKAWTKHAWILLLLALAGLVVDVVLIAVFHPSRPLYMTLVIPIFMMPIMPTILSAATLIIDLPQTAPGAVFILNAGLVLTQLALLLGVPSLTSTTRVLVPFLATMAFPALSIATVLATPLRDPHAAGSEKIAAADTKPPTSTLRSPEDNFSMWSWMTISWMGKLINVGYGRQVHPEDVWLLPYEFQHKRLHVLFREIKGSVIGRILVANAPDLLITSCLGMLESAAALSQIVLLKQLLAALQSDNDGDEDRRAQNIRAALAYAALMLFVRLVAAQSAVFSLWFSRRCYERSRGEMITMIYEKTIRRKVFTFPGAADQGEESEDNSNDNKDKDNKQQQPASMGKILNLMRNDVYEVAQRFWEFPSLFTKPLNFLLSLVLIWNMLGPAALLGILIILLAQAANALVIRVLLRWERARRAVTDLKLQITSQFVETIRHLRWYDWQDRWLGQILSVRETELRYRVFSNLLQKALGAINQLAAFAFPVAAFYAYTAIGGNTLSVDVAFPALNLFTMLNTSLQELPTLVMVILNASVAMARIESFMAEPDKEDVDRAAEAASRPQGELILSISNASFSWPGSSPDTTPPVLRNVNMSCGPGLTVVSGKVGAGKTALLQAILGELDKHSGDRNTPDEVVGYCAQTPWLQSMSVRENILFAEPYDGARYRRVLDACALLPDLRGFEGGDLSMVGENGVGLSGGQKARVALARAVYSRARVLLLDDPIAALDHDTAAAVVRKLFGPGGLCEGRLVVFVTHRVDLLRPWAASMYEVFADREASLVEHRPEDLERDASFRERIIREQQEEEQAALDNDHDHDYGNAAAAIPDKFIEVERRAHGGVMASVYWRYVKAGKLWLWALLIALFVAYRAFNLLYFYFLKVWGEAYKSSEGQGQGQGQSTFTIDLDFNHLPPPEDDVTPWLFWFLMLSIAQFLAQLLADLTVVAIVYAAGRRLFQDVMHRVSAATFRFYDVTPVGRLMNRLTSDIGTVDGMIASQLYLVAFHAVAWLSSVAVIATTTPAFLAIALAMTAAFVYIFQRFLPLMQSLRRLEMVSLSPLMSNFGTLLEGLATVRAFKAEPYFEHRIIVTTDAFQQMDHFYWSLQSWLTLRFDALSAVSTFALTLTALRSGLSSGAVAFVLAAAATFVDTTHVLCRKYGELQMMFVSVERVIELLDLDTEPEFNNPDGSSLLTENTNWPSAKDDIVFDRVTLRYAPRLDPVMRDVSFRIPAGSTVAVTGRTGSGKSTLALALLGTILPDSVLRELRHENDHEGGSDSDEESPLLDSNDGTQEQEPGGSIWIGGVDICRADKHALRRRISFVAQDPVLFPGTLRENLDPLRDFSDAECAAVLARVFGAPAPPSPSAESSSSSSNSSDRPPEGQPSSSSNNKFHLGTRVDGGGKNLSQGQRQLVGIARAVLRRSPLVILDEATASIDYGTAYHAQEVLRDELRDSTVIAIAHREEAVRDANFSIVLDRGRVVKAERIGK